jgi:hypothetical protein
MFHYQNYFDKMAKGEEINEKEEMDAFLDLYHYALGIAYRNFDEKWPFENPKFIGKYSVAVIKDDKTDSDHIREKLGIEYDPKEHVIIPVPMPIDGVATYVLFKK